MSEIRLERVGNKAAIRHVNERAFARQNEVDVADALPKYPGEGIGPRRRV
jgi:predicted N-acetyltransferase YhbS